MIAKGERGVKTGLGPQRCGREADRSDEIAGNATGFSIRGREKSRKIFTAGLGGQPNFLKSDRWRGRLVCDKRQLEVSALPRESLRMRAAERNGPQTRPGRI